MTKVVIRDLNRVVLKEEVDVASPNPETQKVATGLPNFLIFLLANEGQGIPRAFNCAFTDALFVISKKAQDLRASETPMLTFRDAFSGWEMGLGGGWGCRKPTTLSHLMLAIFPFLWFVFAPTVSCLSCSHYMASKKDFDQHSQTKRNETKLHETKRNETI